VLAAHDLDTANSRAVMALESRKGRNATLIRVRLLGNESPATAIRHRRSRRLPLERICRRSQAVLFKGEHADWTKIELAGDGEASGRPL
jgi:hypothetical protein